jgi:thioredoxin-related protein
MEMKKIFLLLFFLSINFLNAEVIENIRNQIKADKNDNIVLIYLNMTGCYKCLIEPNEIINNLEINKKLSKLKLVAAVVCDRDIELKVFSKNNKWKYAMYRNDGTLKSKLKATPDILMSVINSNGEILHLVPGNPKKNYEKILEFIID